MHVIPGRKEEDQTYIVIVLQVTSTDLGMRANHKTEVLVNLAMKSPRRCHDFAF